MAEFERVLLGFGYPSKKARLSAGLFAQATCDGVASHGLNKFPQLIEYLERGWVVPKSEPRQLTDSGVIEQWDGQQGPGDCNAHFAMSRAINIAKKHGLGLVALRNTNHWMRPGNYGWLAVEHDCIGICWSNTAPNMIAWGSKGRILGNNPLVVAIPHPDTPVVLDMAMSQYSYGKLDVYRREGRQAPSEAGYDEEWNLTTDPADVLKDGRTLPAGFWKGSGLSLVLDLLAAQLSAGNTTHQIGQGNWETDLSQVFLAVNPAFSAMPLHEWHAIMTNSLDDLANSPSLAEHSPRHPGASTLAKRRKNKAEGVPVDSEIWAKVRDYSFDH